MHRENITQGVKCVVTNCNYYKSGDLCTAGQIHILPKDAKSTEETDCGTFESSGNLT